MIQLSTVASILFYISTFGLSAFISKIDLPNNLLKLIILIIPPVFLATFRYNVGYDYGSYILGYENFINIPFDYIFSEFRPGAPIAFYLVSKIATIFDSDRVFLMVLSLFALIPSLTYIINEWDNKEILSLIIFAFLFGPFIFSFSACKQGIALSFLVFSLKYVYDRKIINFFICVAIAVLFHSSSIVFSFVYFFINRNNKVTTFKRFLIVAGCMLAIVNLQLILGNMWGGMYEGYALNEVEGQNRTFWLYSSISLLFLCFRKRLIQIDKRNELLIMMMLVGAICQYLGFFNAFSKRIGEYFLIAQVFLLPQLVYIFSNKANRIIKIMIYIYIVTMFILMNPIAPSGMGFIPYQFKF